VYEEIKMRMSSTITSFSVIHDDYRKLKSKCSIYLKTAESLYNDIQAYRNLQCQQRLFHMNHDETKQSHTLLDLQRA
jgi:ABC-type Na+ transport system ATPase subunit NatA